MCEYCDLFVSYLFPRELRQFHHAECIGSAHNIIPAHQTRVEREGKINGVLCTIMLLVLGLSACKVIEALQGFLVNKVIEAQCFASHQ